MKHPERVEDYLDHIIEAIDLITRYVETTPSQAALESNSLVQDAVIRNVMIIGEAVNRISKEDPSLLASFPNVPWNDMRRMRNKMVHNYFDTDVEIVWDTVCNDLPSLRAQIAQVLQQRLCGKE